MVEEGALRPSRNLATLRLGRQPFLCRGFFAGGRDEEDERPGGPSSFLRPISFPEMRVERSASQVSADSSAGSSTREKSGRMEIAPKS